MKQSSSWEANSLSAGQGISRILWNTKVYYGVHKIPVFTSSASWILPESFRRLALRSILMLSSHLRRVFQMAPVYCLSPSEHYLFSPPCFSHTKPNLMVLHLSPEWGLRIMSLPIKPFSAVSWDLLPVISNVFRGPLFSSFLFPWFGRRSCTFNEISASLKGLVVSRCVIIERLIFECRWWWRARSENPRRHLKSLVVQFPNSVTYFSCAVLFDCHKPWDRRLN
jgi:hypothetical protein